jgi:hypothetical protein
MRSQPHKDILPTGRIRLLVSSAQDRPDCWLSSIKLAYAADHISQFVFFQLGIDGQ